MKKLIIILFLFQSINSFAPPHKIEINYTYKKEKKFIVNKNYIGINYKWGGIDTTGFDCSGLMIKILKDNHYDINQRYTCYTLNRDLKTIKNKDSIKIGDIFIFKSRHCAMYIGNDKFIHSTCKGGVRIDSINGNGYWSRYFKYKLKSIKRLCVVD